MTTTHRIDRSSVAPLFLLLAGLTALIASALWYLMFPSKVTIAWYILGAGVVLTILAFILSPSLLRDLLTSRKSWLWINDALLILGIVGIGVLLTHIAHRRNFRYDFTRDQLFSISDKTIKVLRGLKNDVMITAFYPTGAVETGMIKDLLDEYKRQTDRLQYKIVDPRRDPVTTKAMNVTQVGTIIVQCDTSRKDIFEHEIFIRPSPFMGRQETPKFQGEQAITSAIVNVTSGVRRKVQFVKGHGEPGLTVFNQRGLAGLHQYLVKENFDASEVALTEGIPTDTQIVAVVAPEQAFHPNEIQVLRDFVNNRKGHLFVALDQRTKCPELLKFLSETYGVSFNDELLINPQGAMQSPTAIVPEYLHHRIVQEQMERNSGVLMDGARGLNVEARDTWTNTPFLRSPDYVFGKRNLLAAGGRVTLAFDPENDVRGPFTLGVALEGKGVASGTRAVMFGDADFASNILLQVQGNGDLLMNAFNWLAGQVEMISIRPKSVEFSPVILDQDAANRILIICVVVAPLLVLLVGGGVWWSRRRV